MKKIKKLLMVMLTLLMILGVAIPVSSAVTGSTKIVESAGNLFITDESIIDESIDSQGDVYAFSNKVELAGNVDGSVIVAASTIDVEATKINGNIRAIGKKISVLTNDVKNITALATDIIIKKETVAKGVYLVGEGVKFYGEADEVRISGDNVIIKGKVNGDLHVNCTTVTIEEGAEIEGTVFVEASNRPIIKGDFDKDKIEFKRVENTYEEENFISELKGIIPSAVTAILFALILLVIFKKGIEELVEVTEERMVATGFIGFATLIILPIVSILSVLTIVAIPIAIITLIIYGVILYLAPVITAIIITKKYLKDMNKFIFVPIVVLVIKILCIVPIIGLIVYFICAIMSLGSLVLRIVNNIRNN